jgi:predicted secreted protein
MSISRGFVTSARPLARPVLGLAALIVLLSLAGCANHVDTAVIVRPDGSWSGEVRLAFDRPAAVPLAIKPDLDASVQEEADDLLSGRGVEYAVSGPEPVNGRMVYTVRLEGKDLATLPGILDRLHAAGDGLNGPAVLEVRGDVEPGQDLTVALPARPSTGYSWSVDPAGGVVQAGAVESRQVQAGDGGLARQVLHARAVTAGPSTLRLVYGRSWEPDAAPTRLYSVDATGTGLAAVLAALTWRTDVPESAVPAAAPMPEPEGPAPQWPGYLNWCETHGCTPIRDQGACGSCWAFGTVGVLEQAIRIDDGVSVDLSEQYLVSCNHDGYGCDGGFWSAHDLHWYEYYWPETQPGAVPEAQFPYVAWDAPCGGPYSHPYRIGSWSYVRPGNPYSVPTVDELKQAMYNYGPIGVSICVGPAFQGYGGGVFMTDESAECEGNSNHAVVLVGWNDAEQSWKLRNSWGTGWGESGTMRIRWGTSVVGYAANYVSYPPFGPPDEFVYLPVVLRRDSSAPPAGIPNGDFEAGHTAWVEYSTHGWNVITTQFPGGVAPHSGSWATWHGGDYNDESYIQQQVTVPYGTSYLAYYHWISSADACGYDYAYIQVNGSTVRRYDLCSPVNTGGWVRQTLSLAAYAGQSISLRIRVTTDSSLNSNLFVDDVTWAASTAGEPSLPARIDPGDTARRR